MLEFEAKPFVEAIRMLTILDTLKIDNPGEIIDDEVCTTIIKHYERLQECCDALGAPLTKKSAIRAVRHLKKGGATAEKIQDYTREARSRLIDELEAAKLFALRHDVGKYRGGSVCLNRFRVFLKWISALVMPPPVLASVR